MAKNQINQNQSADQISSQGTVEVLYQKMGDRWFAFSCVGDDVFVGSISQDQLQVADVPANSLAGKTHRITGST